MDTTLGCTSASWMPSKKVFLSLGSNLGQREENLNRALAALEKAQIQVTARSSVYESEPQDVVEQPWFLNMVVICETRCFPLQLLTVAKRIERELGRVRTGAARRGPRTIDIDILLYERAVVETPQLVIPHPLMLQRRFVLEPMLEIAPDVRRPDTNERLSNYLSKVAGQKLKRLTT